MRKLDEDRADPAKEPTRDELRRQGVDVAEFLQRTRRYRRFHEKPKAATFAAGLDTDPKDFA